MAHKFELRIIIPPKLIGTIVELLNDEGILVSVEPYKGDAPRAIHRKNRGPAKVYEKLAHEIVGDKLKTFSHPVHVNKLAEVCQMPVGTVSSSLNTLQKANRAQRTGERGYWKAT